MSLLTDCRVYVLVLASVAACADQKDSTSPRGKDAAATAPSFTVATGTTSTLLGRTTFSDPKDPNFKVKRIAGDWQLDIRAMPAMDIAVQSIAFAPGAQSGWHSHSGPVFIQIVTGTITFYESDDPTCTPIVRTAGQGYLDMGEHAHIARNEGGVPATNIVTYFAPPGAPLKIDEPRPGNCPF
jgi:hypothetical protein